MPATTSGSSSSGVVRSICGSKAILIATSPLKTGRAHSPAGQTRTRPSGADRAAARAASSHDLFPVGYPYLGAPAGAQRLHTGGKDGLGGVAVPGAGTVDLAA